MGQDHVLVVDDEPMIRTIIADSLIEAGLQVLEACNADEAFALLAGGTLVSTMVTDVKMPGSMDGLDLAKVVATQWPEIALVVISGHASFDDPRLPVNARFLPKPFLRDHLLKQVFCI